MLLSKWILKNLIIYLIILSTSLATSRTKKFYLYDASFIFNIEPITPLNLILNLHFRKVIKKKESVFNFFYTYQNATIQSNIPYKMRILIPFPVEKSTEINFRWGLKDEEKEELECLLFMRKVKFINNDTETIEFCPIRGGKAIEPYEKVPLKRCETYIKKKD